jgi:hypothetical protein
LTQIAEYRYDGLNRLVKKHIDSEVPDDPANRLAEAADCWFGFF